MDGTRLTAAMVEASWSDLKESGTERAWGDTDVTQLLRWKKLKYSIISTRCFLCLKISSGHFAPLLLDKRTSYAPTSSTQARLIKGMLKNTSWKWDVQPFVSLHDPRSTSQAQARAVNPYHQFTTISQPESMIHTAEEMCTGQWLTSRPTAVYHNIQQSIFQLVNRYRVVGGCCQWWNSARALQYWL